MKRWTSFVASRDTSPADPVRALWSITGAEPRLTLRNGDFFPIPAGFYLLTLPRTEGLSFIEQSSFYAQSNPTFDDAQRITRRVFRASDGAVAMFCKLRRPVFAFHFTPPGGRNTEFKLGPVEIERLSPLAWSTRLITYLFGARFCSALGFGLCKKIARVACMAREEGVSGLASRIVVDARHAMGRRMTYQGWVRNFDTLDSGDRREIATHIVALPRKPKISLLMTVIAPSRQDIERAVDSVRHQIYPEWELCIAVDRSMPSDIHESLRATAATDARIKLVFTDTENDSSLAENVALRLANGDYISQIDQDGVLPDHALYVVAEYINRYPNALVFYSDEDKIDPRSNRSDPHFKPEWNEHLLFAYNLIGHLAVYQAELVRKVGGYRAGFGTRQSYDLALRCVEQSRADQIVHMPFILHHSGAETDNEGMDEALRAANEYFQAKNYSGEVVRHPDSRLRGVGRPLFRIADPEPSVSIIIPTRNRLDLLEPCISSILSKTEYKGYRIVVVDNQSDDPMTLEYLGALERQGRIRRLIYDNVFNYSAINNFAVSQVQSDYICLLNNDTEIINGDWLTEMLSHASRPGIGIVGARLYYPDMTVQHAGVIIGKWGIAAHSFLGAQRDKPSYFARAAVTQELSAVTGACMVLARDAYWAAGGLDEINFEVAFNDIDLCLRIRELGYRNIYTPFTELVHFESKSRGIDDTPEKLARFDRECRAFEKRWSRWIAADPAYNPNLSVRSHDFIQAVPPRVRQLWTSGARFYSPPNPLSIERANAHSAHVVDFDGQLPLEYRALPMRRLEFIPRIDGNEGAFRQQIIIDGWREIKSSQACTAQYLVRIIGWAYFGRGARLIKSFVRLRSALGTVIIWALHVKRPDVARHLIMDKALQSGFDVRIPRILVGPGACFADLIQVYEGGVVELEDLIKIEFLDDGKPADEPLH